MPLPERDLPLLDLVPLLVAVEAVHVEVGGASGVVVVPLLGAGALGHGGPGGWGKQQLGLRDKGEKVKRWSRSVTWGIQEARKRYEL